MATELTVQTTAASGIVLSAMTAADATGNYFTNTGREQIHINNGSGSGITATIVTQGTYNVSATSYPIADLVVTVGAGALVAAGPFDRTLFNDANSRVQITYSAVTTVTTRVIGLGTS